MEAKKLPLVEDIRSSSALHHSDPPTSFNRLDALEMNFGITYNLPELSVYVISYFVFGLIFVYGLEKFVRRL